MDILYNILGRSSSHSRREDRSPTFAWNAPLLITITFSFVDPQTVSTILSNVQMPMLQNISFDFSAATRPERGAFKLLLKYASTLQKLRLVGCMQAREDDWLPLLLLGNLQELRIESSPLPVTFLNSLCINLAVIQGKWACPKLQQLLLCDVDVTEDDVQTLRNVRGQGSETAEIQEGLVSALEVHLEERRPMDLRVVELGNLEWAPGPEQWWVI